MIPKISFAILTIIVVINADEDEPICSIADPDSSQTCISIKFPWKEEPVSFCTEKSNINYVSQCDDMDVNAIQCFDDSRNDTLKIGTPWDCCPYISTPNHCVNVDCPPKPFNRTCTNLRSRSGQCCPTYFCDEGEASSCKLKRMKTTCMKPAYDKANCTAYRDPYGCCAKFQCEEDEKPGNCPSETIATSNHKRDKKGSVTVSGGIVISTNGNTAFRAPVPSQSNIYGSEMRCIGDMTCPDDMKCCPQHSWGYPSGNYHTGAPNLQTKNNVKMIDGVCRKPTTTSESNSDDVQPENTSAAVLPAVYG